MTEPVCVFALFGVSVELIESGWQISGVHTSINAIPLDPSKDVEFHRDSLIVHVFADTGKHTLTVSYRLRPWEHHVEFDILPEHYGSYIQIMEGQFPYLIADGPVLNPFDLYLDGKHIGVAYIRSTSM